MRLATLALRHRIPTIFYTREFAAAGGLASYSGSVTESHRLSGHYAGRILKGEKPGDLPVQQVTRVELIINLKTAFERQGASGHTTLPALDVGFALPASPVRIVINGAKAPPGRNALIGTKFKIVNGTAEIALAMERGECRASATGRGPLRYKPN